MGGRKAWVRKPRLRRKRGGRGTVREAMSKLESFDQKAIEAAVRGRRRSRRGFGSKLPKQRKEASSCRTEG